MLALHVQFVPNFFFMYICINPKGYVHIMSESRNTICIVGKGCPFFLKCLIYCQYSFLHLTACDVRLLQPDKATTRGVNSKLYGPSREIVIHAFFLFLLKVLKYMPSTQFSFLMLFELIYLSFESAQSEVTESAAQTLKPSPSTVKRPPATSLAPLQTSATFRL